MSRDMKLKPCPFCGAVTPKVYDQPYVGDTEWFRLKVVICDACGAQGPTFKNEVLAGRAWNEAQGVKRG